MMSLQATVTQLRLLRTVVGTHINTRNSGTFGTHPGRFCLQRQHRVSFHGNPEQLDHDLPSTGGRPKSHAHILLSWYHDSILLYNFLLHIGQCKCIMLYSIKVALHLLVVNLENVLFAFTLFALKGQFKCRRRHLISISSSRCSVQAWSLDLWLCLHSNHRCLNCMLWCRCALLQLLGLQQRCCLHGWAWLEDGEKHSNHSFCFWESGSPITSKKSYWNPMIRIPSA